MHQVDGSLMNNPEEPPPCKRVIKRVRIEENSFVRAVRLWWMQYQRRVRGFRVSLPTVLVRFFRRLHQFTRFKIWSQQRRARKEKAVREANAALPKPGVEEKLETVDAWFSMLLSPNKPRSVWAVQLILVLLAMTPFAWGGYLFLRKWRIDNLYQASTAAMDAGDSMTAWRTANAAHLMRPDDLEVLRALRDAADAVGHPRALQWGRQLVQQPGAKLEDRLSLTRMAIQRADRALAEQELTLYETSPSAHLEDARILRLQLTASRGRSAKAEALHLARSLLRDGCTSLDLHRIYWSLCMDPLDPIVLKEGLAHLQANLGRKDELEREALRFLLRHPESSTAKAKEYAGRLWAYPSPTQEDALLCLAASHAGHPLTGDELRKQLSELRNEAAPGIEDLAVSRQLANLGRPADAASYYIVKNEEALSPALLSFFKSVFASQAGEFDRASDFMLKSLEDATAAELDSMRQLVGLHKDPGVVIALLERIEQEPSAPFAVRSMLALCYLRLGRGNDLEKLLARTPMPPPGSPPQVVEQVCRLKVLYRQNVSACRKRAERLVAQYPDTAAYRYLLALCYHRSARPHEAHALLREQLSGTPPACPSQRLVGALSLAGVGRQEAAERWRPREQVGWLLQPEREMMGWISSAEE